MQKQITITGGKGGTGKSFIAINLAILLSSMFNLVLADLDLEAPNDHILLGIEKLENEEPIKTFLPFIDTKKCTKCGICTKICNSGAIFMPLNSFPVIFPRLCSGCTACYYACPYNAILKGYHVLGYSYVTRVTIDKYSFVLVTGVLREGEEHIPPAIVVTKNRAKKIDHELMIIDTGAGAGSHISIALQGSDLVIAVTEATPLGLHDLESILKITNNMNLETIVVINRCDLSRFDKHLDIMQKYNVRTYFTIPYHIDAVESYVKGKPIVVYKPDSIVSRSINKIYKYIVDKVI